MADLSITAGNVVADSDATLYSGTAGATITAGQACYEDSSDSYHIKLADADNTSTTATVKGIALNGASDGQPIWLVTDGDLDIGATLTVGEIYVLSGTAGGVCPEADLAADDYVSIVGIATAADNLSVKLHNSGAQVPT
jgi:hypothetical protein